MHGGFAMLEAGAIRSKNAVNILLQTLLDACASALMWYFCGFGFAFGLGDDPNGFIGNAMFALARVGSHNTGSGTGRWLDFFFQWAFCATAATIPAGSVAERCNFNAYLAYSVFISGFLYPVAAHWVWSVEGWLGYGKREDPLWGSGAIDFAGSGVVHMLGGMAGLAGAILLGPRMGRFDADGKPADLPGHSAVLVVLGTVLLWFGWYGFNPASTLFIDTGLTAAVASRAAVTTTLSGAAGGVACMLWTWARTRSWDLFAITNGILCGFVAVTAGCHVYEPWAAILCGACAGVIFDLVCLLLLRFQIDDPLSAGPMHGFCGAFGVLLVGLLAKEEYVVQSYVRPSYPYGLLYGGGGRLLACQVVEVLAIGAWSLGIMLGFFWILRRLGMLRVTAEEEVMGLDISRHCAKAYNIEGSYGMPLVMDLSTYEGAMDGLGRGKAQGGVPRKPQPGKGEPEGAIGDAIMRGEDVGGVPLSASAARSGWGAPPQSKSPTPKDVDDVTAFGADEDLDPGEEGSSGSSGSAGDGRSAGASRGGGGQKAAGPTGGAGGGSGMGGERDGTLFSPSRRGSGWQQPPLGSDPADQGETLQLSEFGAAPTGGAAGGGGRQGSPSSGPRGDAILRLGGGSGSGGRSRNAVVPEPSAPPPRAVSGVARLEQVQEFDADADVSVHRLE
ncbi:hypothetical protein HYH03_012751 [Edaphochlamys debaryana]|uniref:Ammonium transporter n=1 Tax=Edaphochlamys debaryana TaxID=47281 RepID=A0A835XTJ7_9CHLO|nr:hypothetical protein HYH03_012751 [Edaphochlamys debaryana]|eukprot:KAG2488753.1 hypothetical protein HYH03_012751 [Edaphochlamys debaryana]